jgi:hypothetical protein
MKETLAKFCTLDPTRVNISVPWSKGDFTYATDGSILIRVPRKEFEPEIDGAPNVDGMFDAPVPAEMFSLADIELPALEATEKTCPDCNGAGTEDCECPECDGRGMVDFSNRHSDYEVDCKTCDGEGKIHKCDKCNATGKITIQNMQPVAVGNAHFQLKYLLLLKDLPGCKIGPGAKAMGFVAAYFAFDGGDGLLMPMRV